MTPSERERRILPADYESFWERRYNEQHRTLHSCEDALKEARDRAERAEAAARDFAKVLEIVARDDRGARFAARAILARHPSFSGEEEGASDPG